MRKTNENVGRVTHTLLNNKKAITLIALVITIVVLIILAEVAINLTLGNNGIFNKAKYAISEYLNAKEQEDIQLAQAEDYIENTRDTVVISKEEYEKLKEYKFTVKSVDAVTTWKKISDYPDGLNYNNSYISAALLDRGDLKIHLNYNEGSNLALLKLDTNGIYMYVNSTSYINKDLFICMKKK